MAMTEEHLDQPTEQSAPRTEQGAQGVSDALADGTGSAVEEPAHEDGQAAPAPDGQTPRAEGQPDDAGQPAEGEQAAQEEPPAYDYEAERAKKLAYRASLTEEDIAKIRKRHKPENYHFGQKVVEGIEGTSISGDDEERKKTAEELESEKRIRDAARTANWQERLDGMDFDQRVEATVEALHRRPAYSRVMRATLEYCREEHRSEEVEEYIQTLEDFAANRQSPRRYVFFLMRTGALAELGYDAEGNVVDENSVAAVQEELAPKPTDPDSDADIEEPASEEVIAEQEGAAETEHECAVQADCEEALLAEETEGAGTDGAEQPEQDRSEGERPEQADAQADESEDGQTEAEEQTAEEPEDPMDRIVEWRLIVTEVGLAALEATDHRTLLRDLLSSQAQHRFEAYTDLMTFCEQPHSLDDIIAFMNENHRPGLEIDSRGIMGIQPNAYIGKLENAGALTWDGALKCWKTTREALEVLETL